MSDNSLVGIRVELERLKNVATNAVTKNDLREVVESINILEKRIQDSRNILDSLSTRIILLITAILGSNVALNEGAGIRNIVRFFTS